MNDGTVRPIPDPTELTTAALIREIAHVRELYDREFELVERQRVELKKDTQSAIDTALTAQRSETALIRQSVDDLRSRVVTVESVKVGGQQAYAGLYLLAGLVIAVVGIVVALVAR